MPGAPRSVLQALVSGQLAKLPRAAPPVWWGRPYHFCWLTHLSSRKSRHHHHAGPVQSTTCPPYSVTPHISLQEAQPGQLPHKKHFPPPPHSDQAPLGPPHRV